MAALTDTKFLLIQDGKERSTSTSRWPTSSEQAEQKNQLASKSWWVASAF